MLESEAFKQHGRILCELFRKTIRTMVFKLKNDNDTRTNMATGTHDIEQFVTEHRRGFR